MILIKIIQNGSDYLALETWFSSSGLGKPIQDLINYFYQKFLKLKIFFRQNDRPQNVPASIRAILGQLRHIHPGQ